MCANVGYRDKCWRGREREIARKERRKIHVCIHVGRARAGVGTANRGLIVLGRKNDSDFSLPAAPEGNCHLAGRSAGCGGISCFPPFPFSLDCKNDDACVVDGSFVTGGEIDHTT